MKDVTPKKGEGKLERKFIAYFYHGPYHWYHLSLGFHIDLQSPNIEIHLPFGSIRIGWKVTGRLPLGVKENGEYVGTYKLGID